MARKEWFRLDEVDHETSLPAWQLLGHINVEALRHWIRVGKKQGWLKPNHHFKPLYPGRKKSPLLVHIERCKSVKAC